MGKNGAAAGETERERRKAMARTWTRRSHAGGLAAIAAVLLALALALAATIRTNALEVTSSETYYVPVRLRGNLYLVSLTQTSFSYDEGREEAEEERETFFPKVSTFDGDDGDLGIVTFFDDDGVSAAALLKEEEEAEGGGGPDRLRRRGRCRGRRGGRGGARAGRKGCFRR